MQEDTEPKDKFIQKFLDEMIEFKMHAERVTEQYEQMRLLKQTLPASHVTVQVDFAENYVCSYADEVQSAYYSKEQVTIHPSVVHFNKANPAEASSLLSHKSFVIVSDETSHTSGTIFAMIKELVPKIKELVPSLETIHYLSDSPTSQYRNANMFNITSLHKQLFDVSATWQYFESGHGKGPCDGVGGAIKRNADLAVKKGKLIRTAREFYNWGVEQYEQSQSLIECLICTKEDVKSANDEMMTLGAKTIKGTMKIHSVMPMESAVYIRETSCFNSVVGRMVSFNPHAMDGCANPYTTC